MSFPFPSSMRKIRILSPTLTDFLHFLLMAGLLYFRKFTKDRIAAHDSQLNALRCALDLDFVAGGSEVADSLEYTLPDKLKIVFTESKIIHNSLI